ncbi:LysR family transcriptional regulator [Alisedimentitalea sp. MJ-SS2]|uniref:LysR family transcriptional regulator n=1 Tax=Aliisedimentitalea sp. MJ-SS2 TaxID=3049795 RepID=UPI002907F351|nr:LysR family transcriptional regulator [Alisedimentitalea sp. MJ-SS2]MDU8929574.1 LysR family transcriptional regulator [Alisedimentitalea sp. MJ-SS2]
MDFDIGKLDWSLVQAYLAVAETGSLSAAARQIGSSQPTLGRQIKAIEERLGFALFRRHPRGFELTEAGEALLTPARAMREAMREIAMFAAGQEGDLQGTVRITASEMVCHHVLPPVIARMRIELPEVAVELVPTDVTENLLYREADIAVRMYRPEQLEVVARYLGEIKLGLFASKAYADHRGLPDGTGDLAGHDIVGYDRSELIVRGMRQAGVDVSREDFPVRCDDQTVYWELVRAGCGIGFGQSMVARADPEMLEIDLGFPIPSLPVWLAAHEGLRHTPRVRKVWDMLAEALGRIVV